MYSYVPFLRVVACGINWIRLKKENPEVSLEASALKDASDPKLAPEGECQRCKGRQKQVFHWTVRSLR
jgi:hypothetical protein